MTNLTPRTYVTDGPEYAPIESVELNADNCKKLRMMMASFKGRKSSLYFRAHLIYARQCVAPRAGWRRYLAQDWHLQREARHA